MLRLSRAKAEDGFIRNGAQGMLETDSVTADRGNRGRQSRETRALQTGTSLTPGMGDQS